MRPGQRQRQRTGRQAMQCTGIHFYRVLSSSNSITLNYQITAGLSWCQQLEKFVNLDENTRTPTKIIIKTSLPSDGQVDRVNVGPQ